MAQVQNNDSRFGGEFMVQDRDHMSEISDTSEKANRGGARQVEQSHSGNRQQGGDQSAGRQQGGERQRQVH